MRERALKFVLILVGSLFCAAILPAVGGVLDPAHSDTGDTMQMAIYFALGVFLLLAVRNPSAHRSLIAFAAWSSFAHAAVMGALGFRLPAEKQGFLLASGVLVVIGVVLIALAPLPHYREKVSQAPKVPD
jgi:peptidoglycan/LPS O-acetylase OafA/YrhL